MKIEWKTCFKLGISVILVYLCIFYFESVQHFVLKAFGAAIPLLIGGIIAYVVNILMSFYERHYFPYTKKKFLAKSRRPVCMLLAAVSFVGIIVLVVSLILPQLSSCIQLIISQIPDTVETSAETLNKWGIVPQDVLNEIRTMDLQAITGEKIEMISSYFGNMMNLVFSVISSVFSVAVGALLSIIFAFYILLAKDKLMYQTGILLDNYLKPKTRKTVGYVARVLNESFHNYIVGQSTEAVILGVLCMIGMMILRLPYASMIGALVAFTAIIPVVGAYVGAIVGGFMIATVNPMDALVFIIFIIILQQIEGNLIYPKVVGSSLGLPGMWVLAAVTIGGGVLGVAGMLLGVPLAAAIYRIVRHDVKKRTSRIKTEELKVVADEKGEDVKVKHN